MPGSRSNPIFLQYFNTPWVSSRSFLMFVVLQPEQKKKIDLCLYIILQLPYSTTDQSSLNMRGLCRSLLPPDISCLAGRPAIMFSAWVERKSERERSTVHSSWFKGQISVEEHRDETEGWSGEDSTGMKLSGCWTDTSRED